MSLVCNNLLLFKIWYSSYGYENPVHFTVSTLALTVFAIGLAIGVVLSVGALFFFQVCLIIQFYLRR